MLFLFSTTSDSIHCYGTIYIYESMQVHIFRHLFLLTLPGEIIAIFFHESNWIRFSWMSGFPLFHVSAYNTNPTSVDQFMIPFQKAYLIIIMMTMIILSILLSVYPSIYFTLIFLTLLPSSARYDTLLSLCSSLFLQACVSWCEYFHPSTFLYYCSVSERSFEDVYDNTHYY